MAQGYEILIITHPEISDEEIGGIIDKLKDVIIKSEGDCLKVDKWGNRTLAYKIKGLLKGNFLNICFLGNTDILQGLDTLLRYNERVLRYQTFKLDKKVNLESLRESATPEKLEDSAAGKDVDGEKQDESKEKDSFEGTKEELSP
ncbi:MAG: 30S ribosomal protein S6 [Deltaproteobacteria bacterium]|nr:30S ribosomal protein S6 [Deltaproteobacteria bacterium]